MRRTLVIHADQDLPHRPRELTADVLSEVFGGCLHFLSQCTANAQCCSGNCAADTMIRVKYCDVVW